MSRKQTMTEIRNAGRPLVTASVDPQTKARIDLLVRLTGKSRGQIIDMALDALDVDEYGEIVPRQQP